MLLLVGATALASDDVRGILGAALHGDDGDVRAHLDNLGAWAALVLVALTLLHVLVPFPAELANAAAGYAVGVAFGIPLMLGAWLLSALACYVIAEAAGRPLAARVAGRHRLERLERIVDRGGVRALLILRVIPLVPFNALCVAAGLARVPLWRYAATTVVGTIPLTTVCVVFGARLQTPSFSDPVLWLALGGFSALVLLSPVVARRTGAQPSSSST
jgi:uncharacterized membrane protein YdjX (TVP38/TMEM64 family)